MQLLKLSLQGLFSYKEKSSIWLNKPGLTLVDGEIDNDSDMSNGAGKTSIIDAICLCLFKYTTRGTENDDVVNDDMDSGWAALTFLSGQEMYQVQYERDKKLRKTIWRIYHKVDDRLIDISGRGQTETREIIESIIGIDYNAFSNSILFGQNAVSLFLAKDATDAGRKKLFTQILDLDVLDGALQETRDSIKDLEKKQTELEQQKRILDEKIAIESSIKMEQGIIKGQISIFNRQIADIKRDIKALEKVADLIKKKEDEESKKAKAELAITDIDNRKKTESDSRTQKHVDCKRETETAKKQIDEIEVEATKLPDIEKELTKITESETTKVSLGKEVEELCQVAVLVKSEITQRQRAITDLEEMKVKVADCKEDSNCPYCGQGLDETSRHNVNLKADDEIAKKNGEIDNYKSEAEDIQRKVDELLGRSEHLAGILQGGKARDNLVGRQQKIKAAIEGKEIWEQQLARCQEREASIDTEYQDRMKDLESQKEVIQIELSVSSTLAEAVRKELEGTYIPVSSMSQLDSDLTYVTSERDRHNIALGMKTQILGEIDLAKTKKIEVIKQIGDVEYTLKHERFLEEMFGADGIKSLIIMSVTPRLSDLANRYLTELCDRPISIDFVTSYEGKSKTIEDFKILVTRGLKTSDIRSFSGGERKIIEFAVRFAISDIVSEKSGCNMNTLFLDEPFDSLDESRITRSVKLLRSLNEKFPCIFAMCHIAYAREQFDRVVTVMNIGGCSTIMDEAA